MKRLLDSLLLFFEGAVLSSSVDKLSARANALNDSLLLIVLSDRIGIPNPMFYYLVELLPYLAEDARRWSVRMESRKTVLSYLLGEIGEP